MRALLLAIALFFSLALPGGAHAAEWRKALEHPPEVSAMTELPRAPADWLQLEGLYVRVYAAPRDAKAAARLKRHADEAAPRIAERLMIPVGQRIHLYLADSEAHFKGLQPGRAPDWADGTAWPHRGLIFLKSPKIRHGTASPLEQVLEHEIVHILLGRAFGAQEVPRWLQEGMAQWIAGEYSPDTTRRLGRGMLGGGLLSLDELTRGFPADPVRANLAYAQSADLVAFINAEFGPETLNDIVHRMASGTPVRAAFRHATGERPDALDARWRADLEQSGLWLQPLTSDGAFWGLAALIFIVAIFTVRRRNRVKLARWEREEAHQDALLERLQASWIGRQDDLTRPATGSNWVH